MFILWPPDLERTTHLVDYFIAWR